MKDDLARLDKQIESREKKIKQLEVELIEQQNKLKEAWWVLAVPVSPAGVAKTLIVSYFVAELSKIARK